MSFGFSHEEDDDFTLLSNNSNLASLFHDPGVQQESTSKSLVYTAPKQPQSQKMAPATTNNGSQVVIAAAAVTCYKLMNDKYEALVGKIGLALLGESDTKKYQMILYQNKQKPLTNVRITPGFAIISQPDNFCTFYDDLKQNWAVLFDSKDIAKKFYDEVENIKVMLGGAPKIGEYDSKQLSPSDQVDGPSAIDAAPVSTESNSKSKLISRIAKLGQPILPVSGPITAEESDSDQTRLAQSSPENEPQYERSKPKKSARPIPTQAKPMAHQLPTDYSLAFNSMIMPPSHSYQMAMGQQQPPFSMMPFMPSAAPPAANNNNTQHMETLMSENRIQNSEVRMHLCRLTDKIDLLLQKCGGVGESHAKVNSYSNGGEVQLEALATDLKKLQGQSTEHSNKLDSIIKDISSHQHTTQRDSTSSSEVVRLLDAERSAWAVKEKELDFAVQKLKQENDRLIHQIEESKVRLKDNDERSQLLQKENIQLRTNSEKSIASIPDETVIHLREENLRLTTLLEESQRKEKEASSQYCKAQEKLDYYQTKCGETDSLLRQCHMLTEEKDVKLSELQEKMSNLERELLHAKSLSENYQIALKNAEEEIIKAKSSHSEQESVDEQVKMIMNKSYKEIMKQFSPEESYSFKSIKSTVSVVIRDVTLAALNGELTSKSAVPVPEPNPLTSSTEKESVNPTKENGETVAGAIISDDCHSSIQEEEDRVEITTKPSTEIDHLTQPENESKERSISFLETLHSSLAAASLQNEPTWKPDPPPPPLFDDFDNEDDWLA